MTDIHVLLTQIRASRGDIIAQQGLGEFKRIEVNLILDSLFAIIQTEINWTQSGESQKKENQSTEVYIRQQINQSIDDLISYYQADEDHLSQYFIQYSESQFLLMSSKALNLWEEIHQYNLTFNFDQIAWMLKNISSQDSKRIIICLIIQNIQRRCARRKTIDSITD